jgi:histidine phosphotransfer protein HptB
VISIERVAELKTEVGEDDFNEIVTLFIADSDGILDRLQAVSEPVEAEDLLHALKGSALNLGFDELARLCREGQGGPADISAWTTRLDDLRHVYEQSKERLSALSGGSAQG